MMCSSATVLHALKKARLKRGESVAIFGFGGLGFSALQLAHALGAEDVHVVEINRPKLQSAKSFGGIPIDAKADDPVGQIMSETGGRGVDVALELVGSAKTMQQAVQCLAKLGRAALVGLTNEALSIAAYTEIINKEVELVGVSDHLASEIPVLTEFARSGELRFPNDALRTIDLDAMEINAALDAVQSSTNHIRTIVTH